MTNGREVATAPKRDGQLSQIARLAHLEGWTLEKAMSALLECGGARHLGQAIAEYQTIMHPLKAMEPKLDGAFSRRVSQAFLPIGAKMRPDMDEAKAGAWASSIVLALSDLPQDCILYALGQAVHIPFEFPTDMEAQVREIAERRLQLHRTALYRLRSMQEEIAHPGGRQPKLEDANAHDEPMSIPDIRKLLKSPSAESFVNMGLKLGAILPLDLEEARRENDAEG